ncbi:MAG: DUF2232 domain-containing protein [Pseudomonadota bacterium]
MARQLFIALAAGLTAALLFASALTGPAGTLLVYLASLPIFIASLGWGWITGALASLVFTLAIAIGVAPLLSLIPLLTLALPALWLSRLALLARPADEADPNSDLEWYPAGLLLVWTAGLAIAIAVLGLAAAATLGPDLRTDFETTLVEGVEAFRTQNPNLFDPAVESAAIAAIMVQIVPIAAAMSWAVMLLANYALARRITVASGLSRRPLTPLSEIRLPAYAAHALALTVIASFLPIGVLATVASIIVAVLLVIFTINGLSAIHALSLGNPARGLMLICLYVALALLGWIAFLVAIFGVVDALADIRGRAGSPPTPPSPHSRADDDDT